MWTGVPFSDTIRLRVSVLYSGDAGIATHNFIEEDSPSGMDVSSVLLFIIYLLPTEVAQL
jgi:hypothetical protein